MSKSHLMGIAAAVACAGVMATAQTQPQPTEQQHGAMMKGQDVTLVGCLERQSGSQGSASATTASSMGASGFVLTNAMMKAGAKSGSSSMGSTESDDSAMGSMKGSYKVEGLSEAKLKDHVGHRVEVMGKVDHSGMMKKDEGSMGSTGSMADAKMAIQASSIKHVSESCSGASDNQ